MEEEKKKKYRLKKLYPSSSNLGTIVTQDSDGHYVEVYYRGRTVYHKNNIENYPDFWEEVVEKEYTILKYRNKVLGHILNYLPDWDKDFFMTNDWEIYSIRRESDQETFTVGDIIKCWDGNKEIETIYILRSLKDTLRFWMKGQIGVKNTKRTDDPCGYTLTHIKKLAEDQIDIFERDRFYQLHSDFRYVLVDTNIVNPTAMLGAKFSSEEKLREYIIMNKPCLSYKDVVKIFQEDNELYIEGTLLGCKEDVKKYIKNKLNL